MNKSFKPVIILAVLAVFGIANAQPAIGTVPASAPTAVPAPATVPAPVAVPATATVPAPATTPAPVAVPATVPTPAPAPVAVPATVPTPVAAPAPATTPTPVVAPAPVAEVLAPQPPVVAEPTAAEPAPVVEAKTADSMVVLVIEEPKKKKRRSTTPKNEFAIVDVPANFEIQARKVMPITDSDFGDDNLDTWWGRANLMVLTESENFVGKVHLRMYPGEFRNPTYVQNTKGETITEKRDFFQIYEAWAWHRGDYVNVKLGRWDNTARFGSKTFGGYVDARKNKNDQTLKGTNDKEEKLPRSDVNVRERGFMSTYAPENALQFGLNNFSENLSLDIALISSDDHLNKGDLRVYFSFKDLAGLENVDIGIGYRSNVFDEIYNKRGDVTHTVDFGFRMPLAKEVGILKNLNLFAEAALIGLDDQIGTEDRADHGGIPKECDPAFPILAGLDFSLYQGLDKIVIEAEYDGDRKNPTGGKKRRERCTGFYLYPKETQRSLHS